MYEDTFYFVPLRNLLDDMKINKYNSQFTIISAHDGIIMINTTNNILDFGYYNVTHYRNSMYILDVC